MTAGALANIIAINDKLISLIGLEAPAGTMVHSNVVLQGGGHKSLNWSDDKLQSFIDDVIRVKFGVTVVKKNIRMTMNRDRPTVGDLSIAIFFALYKQRRPRSHFAGTF